MRNFLLLPLVAALAACAVGPDYRAPIDAPVALVQSQVPTQAAAFSTASPVAAWWRQFDDPVLDGLVTRALDASPELRVAASRVAGARAVFGERRLDALPHVTAGAVGTRSIQPQPGMTEQRIESESLSLGFDAAWEIDLFGRLRRGAEAARADLDAERAALADVQVSLAAEVARNYFELRGVQRRIDVANDTLESLRKTQTLTEQLWEYGAGTELETQSSLARVKAVEANVPALQTQAATLRHRLAVLLGERPGTLDAELAPAGVTTFARALPIGDGTELLRRRPDVREAERRLAAATARVGVATAELFPRISLQGFIGFLSGDASDLVRSESKAWSVSPSVQWAAFDLGSVRARLRAAEANADGVAAQYELAVLGALEDTENALVAYANRQAQWRLVQEQVAAARRATELAEIRYREGTSDFLTLLDAQRTQLAADDALALAEAGVNVGVVAVYKALGGWGETNEVANPVAFAASPVKETRTAAQ